MLPGSLDYLAKMFRSSSFCSKQFDSLHAVIIVCLVIPAEKDVIAVVQKSTNCIFWRWKHVHLLASRSVISVRMHKGQFYFLIITD